MRPTTALMPFALLLAAGCVQTPADTARTQEKAAADAAALQQALAGLQPQERVTCLPTQRDTGVKAYGPVLVYTFSRGLKYRSDTAGGCEGLERGDTLVTVSNQGRTCQGDIAQTVAPVPPRVPTGSCALGPFTRYAAP